MPVRTRRHGSRNGVGHPADGPATAAPGAIVTCPERKLLISAMDERTDIGSRTRAGLARLAGPWWIFLLTGIGWLILSWIALRFSPASVPTVGVLLGVFFLIAMIN